jgi:hypothetical protein
MELSNVKVMAVILGAIIACFSYFVVVRNTCEMKPAISQNERGIENVKGRIYGLISQFYIDGKIKSQAELEAIVDCSTCVTTRYEHVGKLKWGWNTYLRYVSSDKYEYEAFVITDRCGDILYTGAMSWSP